MTLFASLLVTAGTKPTPLQSLVTFLWNIALSGILCVLGLLITVPLKTAVTRRLEEQEDQANLRTLAVRASYALRDLIKDLAAGVYILAEHQFQIGDQITISSSTGKGDAHQHAGHGAAPGHRRSHDHPQRPFPRSKCAQQYPLHRRARRHYRDLCPGGLR